MDMLLLVDGIGGIWGRRGVRVVVSSAAARVVGPVTKKKLKNDKVV